MNVDTIKIDIVVVRYLQIFTKTNIAHTQNTKCTCNWIHMTRGFDNFLPHSEDDRSQFHTSADKTQSGLSKIHQSNRKIHQGKQKGSNL